MVSAWALVIFKAPPIFFQPTLIGVPVIQSFWGQKRCPEASCSGYGYGHGHGQGRYATWVPLPFPDHPRRGPHPAVPEFQVSDERTDMTSRELAERR